MTNLVGGLLSSTFWKVVGGDAPPFGGRESCNGGRLLGDNPKDLVAGGTSNITSRPFLKKAISNLHQDGRGFPYLKSSQFRDGLCGGRDHPYKGRVGGVRYSHGHEEDWVLCHMTPPCQSTGIRLDNSSIPMNSSPKTCCTSTNKATGRSSVAMSHPIGLHENSSSAHDLGVCDPSHFSMDLSKMPTCAVTATRSSPVLPSPNLPSPTEASTSAFGSTECPFGGGTGGTALSTSGNDETVATSGNCTSDEAREACPYQCVPSHRQRSFTKWRNTGTFAHACPMASPSGAQDSIRETVTVGLDNKEKVLLPHQPTYFGVESHGMDCVKENATTKSASRAFNRDGVDSNSGVDDRNNKSSSSSFVGYREDIRAYDIYQITPHLTEAHYSRLPSALPSLTDSDSSSSDPDDFRKRHGLLRKRKRRRTTSRREGGGGGGEEEEGEKRYKEGETADERMVTLDNVSVYTSPYLEDYTNRISDLHRVSSEGEVPRSSSSRDPARRVSFSPGATSDLHQGRAGQRDAPRNYHTSSSNSRTPPPYTNPTRSISSASLGQSPFTGLGQVKDDDNDVDDEDDDDDENEDDEASTVVPDDFEEDDDETDSDIEVLTQSAESWVDLSNQPEETPDRVTPLPFGNGEEYIRLLREAQRESNQSSARVSLASSRRDTPRDSPHDSPKSPPNSPNTELTTDPEEVALKGVYINYYNKEGDFIRVEKNTETDWIWDWSSRPDQSPPKEWRFSHPGKGVTHGASIRRVMVGKSSLFSRDVLYTLLITNVLSLLIGTGIGIWLSKRSSTGAIVTLPIN